MDPAEVVEIQPKTSYLSPEELIELRHKDFEVPAGGLKRTQNEGSAAELQELHGALDALRAQLSVPRIERLAGRALATWNKDQQVAEVLRKDGKFENFGHSKQGKLFLEYYEALFLLEVGRLQLEYCGTIVSIEQAYVLLLGESESERFTHYLVYSALSRAGYIVVRHQAVQEAPVPITSADCVWAVLKEKLGNKPVPSKIKESPLFTAAEKRMEDLKQLIIGQKNQSPLEPGPEKASGFHFDTRKRRAQSESKGQSATKRGRVVFAGTSLVDQLQMESPYGKFQEIFQKFDIVRLDTKNYSMDNSPPDSSLQIIFDLHLHNEGFKKRSPKGPTFNVIILPPQAAFPTHDEIFTIQSQQHVNNAQLLVISVSESKQIQAFLYFIS
ncbi:uncharacterized protein Dana_GF24994 [Drosophila ananassae]|uniref:tRNA-splicing endonuclease subunit Sen54 N-terminal domain-containing protein n=2 Tax=Drosophila ananassae TaxID=7217 RepID=B3M7U5_DROAN|nr:uncharacterized protein Dana_GF24994 [Drosophila ananassae]